MVNRIKQAKNDMHVVALIRGNNEQYVFVYDCEHRVDVMRKFGRFASNPELSLTWHDAAVLSTKVKQAW